MPKTLRILLLMLLPATVVAQEVHVPDELGDWRQWVLQDRDYRECAFYFDGGAAAPGDFVCAWPGELSISVTANGGRFEQSWAVFADDTWIALPGDASYWPDRVTVNGSGATVIQRDGVPSIRLARGSHRLQGRFEWDERPGVLRVPPQSGLIALTVGGQRVARPEINRNGVFLGERQRQTQSRDAAEVQVYRLLWDNVPTRLITTLQIEVSGSVREELFGPLLPEGFVPMAINSELPARLEADGQLRVQVRPGRWQVSLLARAPEVLNSVTLPVAESNLPVTEIWSYQSNDVLRVTAAEGLLPVDPVRVAVPDNWDELPAYRVARGDTFTIAERSRGIVSAENDLRLQRQMWLDFSGDGFVVQDQIGGTMRRDWRLDMAAPFALQSATEDYENLLITGGADASLTGVELRRVDIDLTAIGRTQTRSTMPVTGWDERFNSVTTTLYLPPGNKLLAAPGADSAPGSWIGQWQLPDFFLVLIVTIAAWKLFGRGAGIVALFALVLSFHEIDAPAWLWLNILIAVALLRVAPAGRLRNSVLLYMAGSALLLVLALVPFVAGQLRMAIFPQLEPQYGVLEAGRVNIATPAADIAYPVEQDAAFSDGAALSRSDRAPREMQSIEEIVVTAAKSVPTNFARYAPNAIVQAGPGIPSWQWNAYRLGWSGPVAAEQSLRLIILPRWAVTVSRFIAVLMLLSLTAIVAAEIFRRRWVLPGGIAIGRQASGIVIAACVGLSLGVSPVAEAQTPSPEILRELQTRLLAPPDCVPRCAEIQSAVVQLSPDSVRMTLSINALEEVAVPIPGGLQGWRPSAIAVDGTSNVEVLRAVNQSLYLRVGPGRHSVVLSGAAVDVDSLEIRFPAPPRVISASGEGWFVAGIKDRRLLSGSLQLTRLQTDDQGDGALRWESSRFPPFVEVHRTVELGLDWRVTTTVQRVAPEQGAVTLELPLLAGESVLTEGLTVDGGNVLVSMNPSQRAVSWQSNLPRTSPLQLQAGAGVPWTEIWRVQVGTVWHADFSGVPESESGDQGDGVRSALFRPRGGESLTIDARRPEATVGSTLAFDEVLVDVGQGARSRNTTLELSYRSTRGAQHVIRLPAGADVTSVEIDGTIEPLRAEAGELTLPILPGEHEVTVEWQEDGEVGLVTGMPDIDIGAPASNITLELQVPENRWLLATWGPKLGPAVLYWSELAALVLLALILGRIDWTPLRTVHWLLLGIGFSTFNWPVLGFVAAWLIVTGAREKWRIEGPWWQFNLLQLVVISMTAISLILIVIALPIGLLGTPDMHVVGNNSWGNALSWFADRSESVLPSANAITVPLWIYKVLILAWALWLSFALLRWLPWVWQCFSREGFFRSRKHDAMAPQTPENG